MLCRELWNGYGVTQMAQEREVRDIEPGHVFSQPLAEASKESRRVEAGVTKALLTTAAGALALSAGFLIGKGHPRFPPQFLGRLEEAWGLLFAALCLGLVNWAVTSTLMAVHANQLEALLRHERSSLTDFRCFGKVSHFLFWAMVLSCLAGFGMLCLLAIALVAQA